MHGMLPIKKGPAPADYLDAVRTLKDTPDATLSWKNLSTEGKAAARRALLAEQGGLCAYCMRKIDDSNSHVEHYVPQSEGAGSDDPVSVDFGNLLAVCNGFEDTSEGLTCDRARKDAPMVVNPLIERTLEGIRYDRGGSIHSLDPEIDHDLCETLNLNQRYLQKNRREVIRRLGSKLESVGRRGNRAVRTYCERYVTGHLTRPSMREPYDGAVIYYMQKRLRAED